MPKEKLLVTGSCGTIGKILSEYLSELYELIGVDVVRCDSQFETHTADVSNFEQLSSVFSVISPVQLVLHLAADPNHQTDWQSALFNNIHGTQNLYSLAAIHGVRKIVFASSNHVTGMYEHVNGSDEPNLCDHPSRKMISVNDPVRADGFYGISKLTGEAIARYYFDRDGIESVCLRIGSVTKSGLPENDRHLCTWLSPDDLIQLIDKSFNPLGSFPGFGIYYGVSANSDRFWDIENASKDLGYHPKDNAEKVWKRMNASA